MAARPDEGDLDAYSLAEFCRRHGISLQLYYKLAQQGLAPVTSPSARVCWCRRKAPPAGVLNARRRKSADVRAPNSAAATSLGASRRRPAGGTQAG